MTTPADVLAEMLRSDSAKPRLTFYDDAEGPTRGERVELSARVLANWVAKAANLLQDDLDAAPATTVGLDLPAHWRAFYWALAAWSVGATLVVGPDAPAADVVVTGTPQTAAQALHDSGGAILVTPAMLARANPDTPPDVVDEAQELATHGDVFAPWEQPAGDSSALVADGTDYAYANVVATQPEWGPSPRVNVVGDLAEVLLASLAAWAADGSIVLVREPDGDQAARLAAEGVTVDLSEG